MYYYKFRVTYDHIEDFVRDIEILATDHFESFHNILFESIGLVGNELASFYICDSKWNKKKEITLIDMQDDQHVEEPEYEDDDDYSAKSNIPKFIMKDSLLKDFITDPHQQIIYEYDFLDPYIFYIELLKASPVTEGVVYPRCTKKEKEMQLKIVRSKLLEDLAGLEIPETGDLDDLDDLDNLDNNFDDDDFADFEQFDPSDKF